MTHFLPVLARIARLNHFPQARNLQETIWKQLGGIMQALGKRVLILPIQLLMGFCVSYLVQVRVGVTDDLQFDMQCSI